MSVVAYINFKGNCSEALDFYSEAFKADKSQVVKWGDAPADPNFVLPKSAKDLVMHAYMKICGGEVMFADVPPMMSVMIGDNISLLVQSKNIDELKSYFSKMKEGGTMIMDLKETKNRHLFMGCLSV